MAKIDVVRALKDEDYRLSLTEEQRQQLPENPAGAIELTDADLNDVAGAGYTYWDSCTCLAKWACCSNL